MFRSLQNWRYATILCVILYSTLTVIPRDLAIAAEVPCRFKAESETTEVHLLVDGKTLWKGTIEKGQTRMISIPEGAFTVISKMDNPNLKRKEDVRADVHTRQCTEQIALTVPLFSEPQAR